MNHHTRMLDDRIALAVGTAVQVAQTEPFANSGQRVSLALKHVQRPLEAISGISVQEEVYRAIAQSLNGAKVIQHLGPTAEVQPNASKEPGAVGRLHLNGIWRPTGFLRSAHIGGCVSIDLLLHFG